LFDIVEYYSFKFGEVRKLKMKYITKIVDL